LACRWRCARRRGWVSCPDKMSAVPQVAAVRPADQLGVDPDALRSYGRRAKTRTGHLRLVAQYLSWRLPTTLELKELSEFRLVRARTRLADVAVPAGVRVPDSARVIRPGPVTVVERVAHAGAEAQRETFDRLAQEFVDARCAALDGVPGRASSVSRALAKHDEEMAVTTL
jgi:Domain of unknown function (DUF4158)